MAARATAGALSGLRGVVPPQSPTARARQVRPPPMSQDEARTQANRGAAAFRRQTGMTGRALQAGHSITARDAPVSGVTAAEMNNPDTLIQVHSQRDPNLAGTVTDQQGHTRTLTRHNVHEALNDQAVDRVRAANGGQLPPEGHIEAGHEVPWQTENVPLDQRNIEYLRNGGRATNPGPLVSPETGEVLHGPLPAPPPPPAQPAAPPPQLRNPLPPAELPPSGWQRAGAAVIEYGGTALRFLGRVTTVYGAVTEANRTWDLEVRNNRGSVNAGAMWISTAVSGIIAGAIDDALAATTIEIGSAPVVDSWEHVGSGPVQHAAGQAIRAFLDWGAHNGL
jgi:hypothetical protein